jgi:hypothetical protein
MQSEAVAQLVIPDEPDASAEGVVNIQLRMPDGSKLQRRFLKSHTLGHIMNFVKK